MRQRVRLILTNIVLAINIMFIHEFKQLDFNLSLIEEWLLVLNDLDCNLLLINQVICFDHLQNKHVVINTCTMHINLTVPNILLIKIQQRTFWHGGSTQEDERIMGQTSFKHSLKCFLFATY